MRLNRFLARSGVSSRRKAEELILTGKITVNSKVVTELATDIDINKDKVTIDGKVISLPNYKYYLLNKPAGYTVTKNDKYAKKTIYELLPKDSSLFSVGRLDRESEGLILITNDGDFAQNIIHPKNKIEKEYEVQTKREIAEKDLKKFTTGVELEDGILSAKEAIITGPFKAVIIITEGKNRQIRRMFKAIGNEVVTLKRIRIGKIKLDIPTGEIRELKEVEVKEYV